MTRREPSPTGYAFPRSSRLLTAADYSPVFKRNGRVMDRYWTILVHRHDRTDARLGMAIAKKRARRAVDRNRLKRVVRDSFRYHQHALAGMDVVVMNRDAATQASKQELHEALRLLWSKCAASRR